MAPPTKSTGHGLGVSLPHLRAVVDCLECGVLMIDSAGQIVLCSLSMATWLGLSVGQIEAMGPEQLVEHVARLAPDPPPVLQERRLLDVGERVVCEEFEIHHASRTILRWVARQVTSPEPTVVVVCSDITTEVDLASAYERQAVTDQLTGLANRRGAEQQLKREVARARRYNTSMALVMLDLDHFKRVNDVFGHQVGDDTLRQMASILQARLRECDLAARWGGEEFLLVLPETDIEGGRACAERIRAAVGAMTLPVSGQLPVSAGVAELEQSDESDHYQAIARADAKLYEAKAAGRNAVR